LSSVRSNSFKNQQVHSKPYSISEAKAANSDPAGNKINKFSQEEYVALENLVREGIKGISSSLHYLEKTVDNLHRLSTIVEEIGLRSGTNSSNYRMQTNVGTSFQNLRSFISALEKIDGHQIKQFLNSGVLQKLLSTNEQE
jgi:hypothetical protein